MSINILLCFANAIRFKDSQIAARSFWLMLNLDLYFHVFPNQYGDEVQAIQDQSLVI